MSRMNRSLLVFKWLVTLVAAACAVGYASRLVAHRHYVFEYGVLNYYTGPFHFAFPVNDLWVLSVVCAAAFFVFYGLGFRTRSRGSRALAIALAATAFELMLARDWFGSVEVLSREALFALAVGALAGWLLTAPDGPGSWLGRLGDAAARSPAWLVVLAGLAAGLLVCHESWLRVYLRQAIVTDAQSQIAQARLLLTGHFTHPILQPLRDVVEIPYALKTVPSYSQFPPGYVLALAPAIAAGLPAQVVCTLAGGVLVALAAWLAFRLAGAAAGWAVVLMLAGSPWMWVMGGTAMNHVPCAALLLATACCWLPLVTDPVSRPAPLRVAAGGLCLGWAVSTRPVTGLAHGLVWGAIVLIVAAVSLRRAAPAWTRAFPRRVIPWAVAGLIVPAAVFLVYNAQTTGTPFKMAYTANNPAGHVLGFRSSGPVPYSLADAADHLAATLLSFNFILLGWFVASWVGLLVWWKRTRLGRAEWILLALIAAQMFLYGLYHFFDLLLGPRFLFELLPLFVILVALGLAPELRRGGAIAGATLAILALLALSSIGAMVTKHKDKYYTIVSRGVQVEEFMNGLEPRRRPTVVVIDPPYDEMIGSWFPAVGGEPPIYFIHKANVARARALPELQGFDWVEFDKERIL